MSDAKWSPEPWRTYGGGIYVLDKDGQTLTVALTDMSSVFRNDEDSRRIVACVNACAGIPTAALESGALAKALDLLVTMEWAGGDDHPYNWCPCCGEAYRAGKHSDSCEWVAALRALGRLP